MDHKTKLLEALNITFDDLSEDRLLDILLDAYKAKKRRIAELESENAFERDRLHDERKVLRVERQRMREDPLYCAAGEYFFRGRKNITIGVRIRGFAIEVFERDRNVDHLAQPIPHG